MLEYLKIIIIKWGDESLKKKTVNKRERFKMKSYVYLITIGRQAGRIESLLILQI